MNSRPVNRVPNQIHVVKNFTLSQFFNRFVYNYNWQVSHGVSGSFLLIVGIHALFGLQTRPK